MTDVWISLGIAAVVLLLMLLTVYNGLAHLRQEVRTAWGDMDAALKRRYDQLPAFLSAVKSSPQVPASAINDAMSAKNRAAVAFSPEQLAAAEADLTTAIAGITTAAVKDPQLSADTNFLTAAGLLRSGHTLIRQRCDAYNQHVLSYNQSLRSFPHVYAAKMFGFAPQPPFDAGQTNAIARA